MYYVTMVLGFISPERFKKIVLLALVTMFLFLFLFFFFVNLPFIRNGTSIT